MVPVLPETAKQMNVTVNGIWGGGGNNPVLTSHEMVAGVRGKYGDDTAAFVRDSKQKGLIVPGLVYGLEGISDLRDIWPNLDDMACRNAKGETIGGQEAIFMCVNNFDWVQCEIGYGKRAIDLGADAILVDTPMSASFIAGFLGGGFCDPCLDLFWKYLNRKFTSDELKDKFGISDFDKAEFIQRLSSRQVVDAHTRPFINTSSEDLLYREFIYCQDQAAFDTRKYLADALRKYAKSRGRKIALFTNAADMGTQNPGGHWVRALIFADIFDVFGYEQDRFDYGMPGESPMPVPKGKWAAYHKLAHSIKHRRSAAVIHAGAMGQILSKVMVKNQPQTAWLGVQCAEAYASNGAYILYHVDPAGNGTFLKSCWSKAIEVNGFVLSHKDFYEGDLKSGADLAVVFLFNERGRTIPSVFPSYFGFAQGLIEGNYPFDVVFAGDGNFVKDRLDSAQLQPYGTIIVPSPISPTANQKKVIQAFAKAGGIVVCQEPKLLGLTADAARNIDSPESWCAYEFGYGKGKVFVLSGDITLTDTHDVGTRFFRQYTDDLRKQLAGMAEDLGLTSLLKGHQDGLVSAFPILQSDRQRLVVHLVNYDVDYEADSIRGKSNLQLTIPSPDFLEGNLEGTLYPVHKEAIQTLPVSVSDGTIKCTIPDLGMSAALVISGNV